MKARNSAGWTISITCPATDMKRAPQNPNTMQPFSPNVLPLLFETVKGTLF